MVDCNNLKDGRTCSEQGPPSDAHSRVADRLGQTHAKNRDGAGHQSGHVDPFRLPLKPSRATAAVTPRRLPTLWLAFSISRPSTRRSAPMPPPRPSMCSRPWKIAQPAVSHSADTHSGFHGEDEINRPHTEFLALTCRHGNCSCRRFRTGTFGLRAPAPLREIRLRPCGPSRLCV